MLIIGIAKFTPYIIQPILSDKIYKNIAEKLPSRWIVSSYSVYCYLARKVGSVCVILLHNYNEEPRFMYRLFLF